MNEDAEALLMMLISDGYSNSSGRVSKKTAIAMMRYVGKDKELQRLVNIGDKSGILRYRASKGE